VPEGQSLARCFPAQLAALACVGFLKEVPLRGKMLAPAPVIPHFDFCDLAKICNFVKNTCNETQLGI
ncbi:MAG: hypothetical protein J1E63_04175, partial [Muribaculaceae bacterium]|nr:hypothetical protein [Muribaculaceae bacterium]